MIEVISAALLFSANVAFGIIHIGVVGIIFGLASHHGRDIGLMVCIPVDQVKVVKNTAATGGDEVVFAHLQRDLIIKTRFFADIGGWNVLKNFR